MDNERINRMRNNLYKLGFIKLRKSDANLEEFKNNVGMRARIDKTIEADRPNPKKGKKKKFIDKNQLSLFPEEF